MSTFYAHYDDADQFTNLSRNPNNNEVNGRVEQVHLQSSLLKDVWTNLAQEKNKLLRDTNLSPDEKVEWELSMYALESAQRTLEQ